MNKKQGLTEEVIEQEIQIIAVRLTTVVKREELHILKSKLLKIN
jgi:hypothetical protein